MPIKKIEAEQAFIKWIKAECPKLYKLLKNNCEKCKWFQKNVPLHKQNYPQVENAINILVDFRHYEIPYEWDLMKLKTILTKIEKTL